MPLSINDYRSWQSVVQLAVFALGGALELLVLKVSRGVSLVR
jgi:hypothetical protein